MGNKNSKKRQRRQKEHQQRKKVKSLTEEPPLWAKSAFSPNDWLSLHRESDKNIWLLLAASLHILFALMHVWEPKTTATHSGPYYALLLWRDAELSDVQVRRLKNVMNKTTITDAACAQKAANDIWKAQVYEKATALQYSMVQNYIVTNEWIKPTGVNDDNWANYSQWRDVLAKECDGVARKRLYNDMWPLFVEACNLSQKDLQTKLEAGF